MQVIFYILTTNQSIPGCNMNIGQNGNQTTALAINQTMSYSNYNLSPPTCDPERRDLGFFIGVIGCFMFFGFLAVSVENL